MQRHDMRSRTCALVAVAAIAVATLLASALGQEPRYGGTLRIADVATPRGLHGIIDPGAPGITILHWTEEGLLTFDESSEVVPLLAVDMPENPDPLTYVFHLRQGVKFHSGDELTAEDVVFTYERLYLPDSIATFAAVYQEHIASVEALDTYTVRFNLHKPWPIFLSFVAGNHAKVVNKTFVEEAADAHGVSRWDGTGPFRIVEWVRDSHVRLVKHADYWQEGRPYLDDVIVYVIPEPSTMYANFQAGEIDFIIEPPLNQLPLYEALPFSEVRQVSGNAETLVVFRTSIPPMDDARVRRAISLAVDRQLLVDVVIAGYGSAGGPLFPPHHWAHNPEFIVEQNQELARELLAEAGYGPSNPLEFTLIPINEALYLDTATIMQAQLAEVGVTMHILTLEYTTASAMSNGPHQEWAGDAALFRIRPLRSTAFEFTWNQYSANAPLNRSGYNRPGGYQSPRADELIEQANVYSDFLLEDREAAYPLYTELNRIILEDSPQLILYFWDNVDIVNTRVQGLLPWSYKPDLTHVWLRD